MRTILRSQKGDCFEDFEASIVCIEGIDDEEECCGLAEGHLKSEIR